MESVSACFYPWFLITEVCTQGSLCRSACVMEINIAGIGFLTLVFVAVGILTCIKSSCANGLDLGTPPLTNVLYQPLSY